MAFVAYKHFERIDMKDLRNQTLEDLEQYVTSIGEKRFRAKQIYEWVAKGADTFDAFSNVSKNLRVQLEKDFYLDNCTIVKTLTSKDGTLKTLSALKDGERVESVFMTYKHGHSACISTQVGCKMGCSFCASTLGGVVRHLNAGEYMGQLYALQKFTGKRISNVVLMGSGEPLDNYDETVRFIKMATDEKGLNLSVRNITVSTCGLPDEIEALAREGFQITLAISLHNPFDDERSELMPINRRYGLKRLMSAVETYIKITGRRVSFEYALINGINDTIRHADALGQLLRGKLVHVNLIPINAVEERAYNPSDERRIEAFKQQLIRKYRLTTTVRRELGSDINAACGQLRNEKE